MPVLEVIGSVGRYQWSLIGFVMFSALLLWNNTGILIMAPTLSFECVDQNFSGNATADQCYYTNQTDDYEYADDSDMILDGDDVEPRKCRQFKYDHSMFQWTLTERFQLICERQWLISLLKSVYIAGYFVGSLLSGFVADRFGRRRGLLLTTFSGVALNCASAFVPDFWAYLSLRFFTAIAENGTWLCVYVLTTESLRKDHRMICKILDTCSNDVATALLGGLSLLMANYQYYHLIFAGFYGFLFLAGLLVVQESPQWLLHTRGGEEGAREIVDKIARINKTDAEQLEHLLQTGEKKEQGRFCDLFRTPLIRKRTFILFYIWSSFILTWYAITYNLGDFSADVRISLLIAGAMDIPSAFIMAFFIKHFGRTRMLFLFLMGSGLCCLGMAPLIEDPTNTWLTVLALAGKQLVGQVFMLMYLLTPELYPTVIRVMGLGACSTISRPLSALAPQIVLLNRYWPPLMVVSLGSCTVLAALLVPLLPDMTDVELPQTIEDGENLFPEHGYSLRRARPRDHTDSVGSEPSPNVTA